MQVSSTAQNFIVQLGIFQKKLDAAQKSSQAIIKIQNTAESTANNVNIDNNSAHLLEFLFEKVGDADPLYLDLHLLRLYIISKVFTSAHIYDTPIGESVTAIKTQIINSNMSGLLAWLESRDELVGYTAAMTLVDICLASGTSHVTDHLYFALLTSVRTNQRALLARRVLALFTKELKLALKTIKTETDAGDIDRHNPRFAEAMKLLFLFGSQSVARTVWLKYDAEDITLAAMELFIHLLKLLTYLDASHVPAEQAQLVKQALVNDVLFTAGARVVQSQSYIARKKYLRLCSLLMPGLTLEQLQPLMSTLTALGTGMCREPSKEHTSIFGLQVVLATRRRYILLLLELAKNVLSSLLSAEHVLVLSNVARLAVSLLRDSIAEDPLHTFFELFQEQDDDLMTALWHSLTVYVQWTGAAYVSEERARDTNEPLPRRTQQILTAHMPEELVAAIAHLAVIFNPHRVFHELLSIVDYDHNVLLDFLVSNETDFLLYLLQYLKYASNHWNDFVREMATFDTNEAQQYLDEAQNNGMSAESKRELEEMLSSMSKLKLNNANAMDTNESNEVKRVIEVMHKLGTAINRLVTKELFPYNIAPLLRWIEHIERQCNN